jgi:hypothetical protein
MPPNAGIQVTDSVRHTVGKRYPGHGGWNPGFYRGNEKRLDSAGVYPERRRRAGMTGMRVDFEQRDCNHVSERHIDKRSRLQNPLQKYPYIPGPL